MSSHLLKSDTLTVNTTTSGAEMISIKNSNGDEYLWQANPDVWGRHAPHLFPIVGRLQNDTLAVNGQNYPMTQHGFARDNEFILEKSSGNSCTYLLTENSETLKQYPFKFELRVHYQLENNRLSITYDISNTGDSQLPCSIGAHPAFNWPQPGNPGKHEYRLRFSSIESAALRRLDEGLLKKDAFSSPIKNGELALEDKLFDDDAMIYTEHSSRKVTLEADGTAFITVDFDDFPHLGIWTKPGADFICIEPWQGHSDPVDFTGDFSGKPGVVSIQPGESRQWVMNITVHQ